MLRRTTAMVAIATVVVALNACGARPDAERPSRETTHTGIERADDEPGQNRDATTADIEPALSTDSSHEEHVHIDPADEAQLATDELDAVLADLDNLLAELSHSFNQTEGDLQP